MNNKTKKIMAILCLALIVLTSLPIQTFATFITNINSNAQFGVISGSLANYGHEMHYANYDGATYLPFCTQYGKKSPTGIEYTYNGDFIVHYKNSLPQYEKISEMIYFGYTMNYGTGLPTSQEAIRAACATQQYVWEALGNAPSRDSWNGNYMSSGIYASWLSQTEQYYNQYHGNTSFNGTTNKVTLGDTTTLNDTTGRLASYSSFNQNINGITFSHTQGSNALNITVPSECTADRVTFSSRDYGLYQLMPNGSAYSASTMSNYVYFEFTSGAVQDLMFSNYVDPSAFSVSVEVEYGNTLLIKTNTNGDTLAGCTFALYKDKGCTQKIRTGTSDSNGQIFFQRLAPATYYIKEISVPSGYLLDTTVKEVRVNVNETAEVSFKNDEPTGELKLIKTDVETGNTNRIDGTSHHGDASIDSTEYTLYAKNDIYNVARTIKYFSKDEKIATFTFNSNGIAKINISTGSKTANLITDGNILKNVPLGSYYARESKIPTGYLPDNEIHNITLSYKDMNTRIIKAEDTFTNQVQKAKFEVIKVSSITNETAPILENAEFTAILTKYVEFYGSFDEALKHLEEFSKDEYSVFKTEANGHGISRLLAYGEYTVQETYCPSDLVNPVKPFKVVIDKNSPDVIKELVENDTPFESYIKMIKKDVKTGKIVTFSNATFSLYRLNEENDMWERVSCKVGRESFNTWTTDKDGLAYTETKLVAGTYKINEVKVPNGFLQLDEEIIFKVNRSNETVEYDKDYDAYITVTVENEQPTGTLIIDKSVAIREDIDTSMVDISDLSGIEFTLTAKEDVIDYADGSMIYEKGKIVKVFNLDKDGNFTLPNLPMGIYNLQETKTIEGLVLNDKKYEVKFEQKDLTTKVYEEKKDITNDTTVFEFSKTDITGDKELSGATLTVTDKNGNIIDTWVSGEKTHKIEGLEVGKTYILNEEITPNEYVKATSIQFQVKNTNDIQKVTMVDKIVEVSKTDIVTGEEIEGAELEVIDKETGETVDKWTSSKTPHKVIGLEENKTYILKETSAPYGYEITEEIEFKVTDEKLNQKIEMKDMPILKEIKVIKINSKTQEEIKDKFTFAIYNDPECKNLIKEVESNKNDGYITFEDLRYGIYYIKELKAPKGYVLSDKIVKVEINEEGVFVDNNLIEEKDEVYSFIFENAPIETPNTRR